MLIYQRTDAPVAVSPVRSDAVKAILAQHPDVQIIVTDDGLQHYRLARDVEIVVIDGVRRFGNGWWLPAGPMRERAGRLKSVDAVIVNGGVPRSGEIPMHLLPGQAVNLRTGKMCGVQPEKCVPLADHQSLNHADVSALVSAGQTLVMTEKDAVKCRAFAEENWCANQVPIASSWQPIMRMSPAPLKPLAVKYV